MQVLQLVQDAVVYGPAVIVVGGKQVALSSRHRVPCSIQIVLGGEQGIFGDRALLILQLIHPIVVLLHGQRGLGGGQRLGIVLDLGVQGAEAQLKALDRIPIGILGRLPGVFGLGVLVILGLLLIL